MTAWTRTVHPSFDPALRAYLAWLGDDRPFSTDEYDLFAAGYRADRAEAEAALRCCETGPKPAYKRGRYASLTEARRYSTLAYRNGRRQGALRALVGVGLLGLVALVLGRRG
jgi:hypothetical protein